MSTIRRGVACNALSVWVADNVIYNDTLGTPLGVPLSVENVPIEKSHPPRRGATAMSVGVKYAIIYIS
jgi:hypothetical protein